MASEGVVLPAAGCDRRPSPLRLAQGPERHPELFREQYRLLPGGEVVALVDLVEAGQVGVGTLGPAARRSMSPTWGLLPTSRNALPERGLGSPTQRATPARVPSGPPSAA